MAQGKIMALYNDPKTGKTVEAKNSKEAKAKLKPTPVAPKPKAKVKKEEE